MDSEALAKGLFKAITRPDAAARKEAAEAWVRDAIPLLVADMPGKLRAWVMSTIDLVSDHDVGGLEAKTRQYLYSFSVDFRLDRKAREVPEAAEPKSQAGSSDDGDGRWQTGRTPNDDRSDSMNPNNAAHEAAMDNRSNQMNPNNPAYGSSRGHR